MEGYTPLEYVFTERFISDLQFYIDLDVISTETRFVFWTVYRNTDNILHKPKMTQVGNIMVTLKGINFLN